MVNITMSIQPLLQILILQNRIKIYYLQIKLFYSEIIIRQLLYYYTKKNQPDIFKYANKKLCEFDDATMQNIKHNTIKK